MPAMNKACKRCDHWDALAVNPEWGLCKIESPSITPGAMKVNNSIALAGDWPATSKGAWCGKFTCSVRGSGKC